MSIWHWEKHQWHVMVISDDDYIDVVRCAIWYHLYNLKNVKNTQEGVLILLKFPAFSLRFPWLLAFKEVFPMPPVTWSCTNQIEIDKVIGKVMLMNREWWFLYFLIRYKAHWILQFRIFWNKSDNFTTYFITTNKL